MKGAKSQEKPAKAKEAPKKAAKPPMPTEKKEKLVKILVLVNVLFITLAVIG
jgi:hypothetical protein